MKLANRVLALFFILGFISVFLTLQVRAESNSGNIYENFLVTKSKAEQGDVTAQSVLGIMYYNGEGVPQDNMKAVHWFTKAAEQGEVKAQSLLGIMYYKGEGVSQNYVKAYVLLNLAASQGNTTSKYNKEILLTQMSSSQIEEGQKLSK